MAEEVTIAIVEPICACKQPTFRLEAAESSDVEARVWFAAVSTAGTVIGVRGEVNLATVAVVSVAVFETGRAARQTADPIVAGHAVGVGEAALVAADATVHWVIQNVGRNPTAAALAIGAAVTSDPAATAIGGVGAHQVGFAPVGRITVTVGKFCLAGEHNTDTFGTVDPVDEGQAITVLTTSTAVEWIVGDVGRNTAASTGAVHAPFFANESTSPAVFRVGDHIDAVSSTTAL